ncbi:carboxypeptidase regulatory-like domain-containing protein [Alloacidobacterium dinghuense]|uniref:Carboxypeptidase regulatory-like domain-containing protein n=1 Tax=Alloacidobacterium dinghuense TaxID=2763107 RepID=A0A7G8BK87_9BACT|nr:carboxypeptidase-like regulatory domain-containing protein [Alloacidobacterium dinghuense]QNI32957.1 carboxypeptidase regulatory-like domain-containing protein [Alloacidobacterium dinghuense]
MRRFTEWGRRLFTAQAALIVFVLSLALLSSGYLYAQANAGITGTVTDPSGAVVAGASVTITNQGTGVENHATTGSAGTYAVTGLTPGVYSVAVEASGFKKNVQNSVNVEVTVTATINITLSTGSTAETVEVTASSIALNTTAPQLGSTIEPTVVAALPTEVSGRGRQVDSLQLLAPGTTGSAFSHRISGGVDFEQEILYNGVPAPQPETEGYTTNFNPPFEMVNEFHVERTTFSAQFGLGQGALTYQMASGTNKYHGDLFEINRNSFFDSVGFFNGPAWGGTNTPPTDRENNYGFSVGGPISIPKLYDGRNRTFGHYSQEWYKENSESTDPNTVPTALQKTGDFSDFVDGSTGKLIPIYDNIPGTPEYGQQFSYNGKLNVIPPNMISPTSASLLQYLPNPDRPGSGIGGLDSNKSFAPFINPHIQHVWGFTVDQVLTPKQGVHYSMWRNTFSNYSFDGSPNRDFVIAPNPLNSQKFEPAKGLGIILTYDNTITPNLVMTAGFGWIGEINNQFNQTKYSFPAVAQGVIPANITFDGTHAPTNFGTDGAWLQSINRKLGIAIVNNWLWTKGRHTFNIGGDFRRSYQDDNEEQTAGGQFAFSQRSTASASALATTGSSFASYLLGTPDSAARQNSQELQLRNFALSPYIQDDIKLTPKLTVNLGMRWDITVPFTENHNNIVFFTPNATNPDSGLPGAATKFGSCTGCAGYERADIHWGHIGPRLGFAYQVNNKTVVQGGFSIAFLNGGAYEYGTSKVAVNYGNLLVGSFNRGTSNGVNSSYGSWDTNIMPNPGATAFNPGLGVGTQINDFSKNDGYAPYSQQWNVNVQRQIPYDIFVTAAWVGNRVIHLPSQLNTPNQLDPKYFALGNDLQLSFANGSAQAKGYQLPYPNFVNDFAGAATVGQSLTPYPQYSYIFNNFEAFGTTYYEGLQLQVEKRFTNGLAFLAGYTLSKLMDNTSSGFSSFTAAALNKYNQKPEWAVSGANETNTFKMNGTYELPIGPGKAHFNNRGWTGQLLGGWQVAWILDYEAGQPLCGCNNGGIQENGNPYPGKSISGPNVTLRPNRNPGVGLSTASYNRAKDYFVGKGNAAQMFNPAAFSSTSSQYVLGNAIRNYGELKGPALYNEDANISKRFFFGERFSAVLRMDYFNFFNRTQFQTPDPNISNGTFGQVIKQGAQNGPSNRQGQISARFEF